MFRFASVLLSINSFVDITFSTDTNTDPGGMKELYSIGVNYNVASI